MIPFISLSGTVIVLICLPVIAHAQWEEGFEDYVVGSSLHGQGGWEGWQGDDTWTAYVSDAYASGGTKSVEIVADADLVHKYCGANFGAWTYTCMQYIPSGFSGESYFILLNTYEGSQNWSIQVRFDSALAVVESEFEGAQLPLITGRWVEIGVEIDLDGDWVSFTYDGALLTEKSWTDGVSGGGAPNVGAVDLFANGATPIYYDDFIFEADCLHDIDDDGTIGLSDLAALLANYGMTSGACYTDGDLDFDGDVDLSDLATLLAVYGEDC